MLAPAPPEQIIKLAILAVGGQGGGVITDWIVALAERERLVCAGDLGAGRRAAHRRDDLLCGDGAGDTAARRCSSLMPAPGDVDIVLAAELMEAGRAMQRGLVTPDRTTLITSTHRTLAVDREGRARAAASPIPEPVLDAARKSSKRFLGGDLERLAEENGSVISASLFGALAGADVLPFPRESFEATIADGGRGAKASLAAFRAGLAAVREPAAEGAKARRAPCRGRRQARGRSVGGPAAADAGVDDLTVTIAAGVSRSRRGRCCVPACGRSSISRTSATGANISIA